MLKALKMIVVGAVLLMSVNVAQAQDASVDEAKLALSILNTYINSGSHDPAVYELRGDAYKVLGETAKAKADYSEAAHLAKLIAAEEVKTVALAK